MLTQCQAANYKQQKAAATTTADSIAKTDTKTQGQTTTPRTAQKNEDVPLRGLN